MHMVTTPDRWLPPSNTYYPTKSPSESRVPVMSGTVNGYPHRVRRTMGNTLCTTYPVTMGSLRQKRSHKLIGFALERGGRNEAKAA
jgi:hypothetical protein